ncbi:MAG: class I SAM-dependent methyltransferase [Pseudomonadota bacterium]
MSNERLERVYGATDPGAQRHAYDQWADQYERDLCAMGYRLPAMLAAVFARFVPLDTGAILDAGCGTGMQAEALHAVGYRGFVGIDLSPGMLGVAQRKGLYTELQVMALGQPLAFDDNRFGAVLSTGAITPGHAPPESFDELIRVCVSGGFLVFSLRDDAGQDRAYLDALPARDHLWRAVFRTPTFQTMPYGEPEIRNRVYVYQKH